MIDIEQLKSMMKPASRKVEESVPAFELDDDGEEYMSVGTDGVLAASEKLLAINRGLADPDERDSLKFQKILRPHSMLRESIKMDAGKISRQLMYQAARKKDLSGVQSAAFDPYVERLLVGNPLTSPLEEINPMQLTESARRVTKMGPGGLGSSQSITEEAQSVHPSQFGFISAIEGPECFDNDTQVLTKTGWLDWPAVTEDTELACLVNGVLEFHKPERVVHEHYEGTVYGIKTKSIDLLVTPGHRIYFYTEHDKDKLSVEKAREAYGKNIYIPTADGKALVTCVDWYTEEYTGTVHCATVSGGMLYVARNGCPGFWSGNSERAGIDVRIAWGAKLGSNGRLYQKFYDRHSKKMRWMSPEDVSNLTIKIPD